MLHQCVPVVTGQFALPEIVEDVGYIVPYGDEKEAVEAIHSALEDKEIGRLARDRVLNRFSHNERSRKLLSLLNHLGH